MKNPVELFCIAAAIFAITLSPDVTMGYEKEISSLAESLKGQIQSSGKKKVAVVDFTDLQGSINELGRFLAEELSTGLLEAKGTFEVIDRSSLQSLLKENKLSATGLIDPKDTQKIVKVSGVDALITGNITSSSDSMRLSVKILDAETAKLIGASKANLPATAALKELWGTTINGTNPPDLGQNLVPPSGQKLPTPAKNAVEEHGIVFALQGCKRKGQNVKCDFLVTSIKDDVEISISANRGDNSSVFYDNSGNKFPSKKVILADKNREDYASEKLYKDVAIKMALEFEFSQTDRDTEVMRMLLVNTVSGFVVKFNNVSINRTE